jgi:O-antigen/teichoic acid export membrane protein
MWPLMVGLAVCAKPIVVLLLTEKWLPCVPYLQIFCFSYVLYPIHTANLNAIRAVGRSDIFLKLEIIKKVIGMTIILISMNFGVFAIAVGVLISGPISVLINAFPNIKLLHYSISEQINDLYPYILLAAFMGVCIYPIQFLPLNAALILVFQIILGVLIYAVGAIVFRFDTIYEVIRMLQKFKKNRNKEQE